MKNQNHKIAAAKSKRPLLIKLILIALALVAVVLIWAALARHFAPTGNTQATRFDAIIVLGYPADDDGNPTPTQLSRVTEAVHEYEHGVAPRLILTGGPAHNNFVEAEVMARAAQAQGVPASAIVLEPRADSTIQNACFSLQIMQQNGWHSAEVISNSSHLPRSGLIFSHLPIEWRTHAAPPLGPQAESLEQAAGSVEMIKTFRYLVLTQWTERCETK